jgi:4-hydroxybenzoyl-CoA thioesterase
MYRTTVRVRFGDIDKAGIVYYPRVLNYFHMVFEEFFDDEVGIPYHDLLEKERMGFPTVHLEVDFIQPMQYGDRLTVTLSTESIGNSSVRFCYEAFRPRQERPCARGRVTVVAIDMDSFRSKPLPPHLRKAFEKHLVPERQGG